MKNITKLTRKELSQRLGVSYPTALKEYKIILASLGLKRNYLTNNDLEKYLAYD